MSASPRKGSTPQTRKVRKRVLLIAGGIGSVAALVITVWFAYWGVGKLLASIAEQERRNAAEVVLKDPRNASLAKSRGLVALPLLLEALNSQDAKQRLAAVQALGTIGEPAKESLGAVNEILNTAQDAELVAAAAEALGSMGPTAAHAVPDLIAVVQKGDSAPAQAAMRALERIGPTDSNALVPALLEAFQKSDDLPVRLAALDCLGAMGLASKDSLPVLLAELQKARLPIRQKLIPILVKIDANDPRVLDALSSSLSREDTLILATEVLGSMGVKARSAVPALFDAIDLANGMVQQRLRELERREDENVVRTRTYNTRGEVVDEFRGGNSQGSTEQTELQAILRALRDLADGELAQVVAAYTARSTPELLNGLKSKDQLVQVSALKALSHSSDVSALMNAMASDDRQVRRGATEALAACGSYNPEAVTLLLTSIQEGDEDLRKAVCRQLIRRGIICNMLTHDSGRLDDLYSATKEIETDLVVALTEALNDTDLKMRIQAADSLRRIGPSAQAALPALSTLLGDADFQLRITSASAVVAIGSSTNTDLADKGTSVLGSILEHEADSKVRQLAAFHLSELGARAVGAIPALLRTITGPDEAVGAAAARTLNAMGPPAKSAVPALQELVRRFHAKQAEARLPLSTLTLFDEVTKALEQIDPAAAAAVNNG